MAVAKGQQTVEAAARTLYIGMGAVKVLGVNMSKAELEKLYGRDMDDEPKYVSEATIKVKDANGVEVEKKVPSVRISFVVTTDPEKNNGIEALTNHTFFLQKRCRQSNTSGKYQIIDKYGRTAWATREEIEAKQIPMYSNGPANIDADYRLAFVGEEPLTLFIKNYLNIPNIQSFVKGAWVPNTKVDPKDCEMRLDCIEKYFKGDFKELKEIASYQPDNLVNILFGIRTTDENKQYQTTYTDQCYKANVTDFSKLDAEIQEKLNAGYIKDTEYQVCPLREYVVESSQIPLEQAAAAMQASEEIQAMEADPWAN